MIQANTMAAHVKPTLRAVAVNSSSFSSLVASNVPNLSIDHPTTAGIIKNTQAVGNITQKIIRTIATAIIPEIQATQKTFFIYLMCLLKIVNGCSACQTRLLTFLFTAFTIFIRVLMYW